MKVQPLSLITPANAADTEPEAILKQHGRTFHLASRLLETQARKRATRLYAFCRWVDDLADQNPDPTAAALRLDRVREDLLAGQSRCARTSDFLNLSTECELSLQPAVALITGLQSDLGPVRVENENELLCYAYRVAGTVGEMMSTLLGCTDPRGRAHAIDLGIAMQLTNIARDVAEDAARDRMYLPRCWLRECSPVDMVTTPSMDALAIRSAILRTVRLADSYYNSGRAGLSYLPSRSRLAIAVAATLYREIGVKIQKCQAQSWRERMVISTGRRLWLAARELPLTARRNGQVSSHRKTLHQPFDHLLVPNR